MEKQSFVACAFEQRYIHVLNSIRNPSYCKFVNNDKIAPKEWGKVSAVRNIKFPRIQVTHVII